MIDRIVDPSKKGIVTEALMSAILTTESILSHKLSSTLHPAEFKMSNATFKRLAEEQGWVFHPWWEKNIGLYSEFQRPHFGRCLVNTEYYHGPDGLIQASYYIGDGSPAKLVDFPIEGWYSK